MTRDEAIEILKTDGCYECYVEVDNPFVCNNGGCEIREAYYMAIEALERKRGEWIQHVNEPSLWSCSICETVIYSEHDEDRLKYHKWCGCCGADMSSK